MPGLRHRRSRHGHQCREHIQRAAEAVSDLDETIADIRNSIFQLTQPDESVVGERGVKLSGGQRQRVAIARAVLADPRILILDEATSSLDSESEAMIQGALGELRKGRTTFVIAHRLSTIRSADQILVIEDGQVVERGDHSTLLAMGGRYRELHDRQYNFESNRFINPGEDFSPEPEKIVSDKTSGPPGMRSQD